MQRSLGMIFLGHRRPERGHHRIPHELLDRAADTLDLSRHRIVEAIQQHSCPFGVLGVPQFSRADQVGEKHRDELAFLRGRRCRVHRSGAGGAEACVSVEAGAALRTDHGPL